MGKREVLGTMTCPECGHPAAEVKPTKNGTPYRYCPECDAQYFPRSEATAQRLLAKIGQGPLVEAEKPAAPAVPAVEVKGEGTSTAKPAATPAAPPPKAKIREGDRPFDPFVF